MQSKWVLITFRPVDWIPSASNVDSRLQAHKYLLFPSKTNHTDGIKAGIMTSFGFSQVGGSAVIIHPRYLWGAIEPSAYARYRELNRGRALASYISMSEMMIANNLVKIKENPPYTPELEAPVLLNSKARASPDKTGSYAFTNKLPKTVEVDSANLELTSRLLANSDVAGVGVDQGPFLPLPF
jgi:fatty acid synthase subunit alpha